MVVWRISRHRDLSGIGGLKAAGRTLALCGSSDPLSLRDAGISVARSVCTSAPTTVPPEFTLLKIEGPKIDVPRINSDVLPDGWRNTTGGNARPGDSVA